MVQVSQMIIVIVAFLFGFVAKSRLILHWLTDPDHQEMECAAPIAEVGDISMVCQLITAQQ
eukprot:2302665-Amphidinium_carterae.4